MTRMSGAFIYSFIVSLFFSYLFLMAGIHKISRPAYVKDIIVNYRIIPERVTPLVARLLPLVECAVGAGLLIPGLRAVAGWCVLGLLLLYTLAIAVNLFRGRDKVDCGCGGATQRQYLSKGLLLRNLLLAGAALLMVLLAPDVVPSVIESAYLLPAIIFLAIFYQAANQLVMNSGLWSGGG